MGEFLIYMEDFVIYPEEFSFITKENPGKDSVNPLRGFLILYRSGQINLRLCQQNRTVPFFL